MPPEIVSNANAEHYTWSGGEGVNCDAWYLVRTPGLNIIEERMPPGAAEKPHHHTRARQFFFVLAGELTLAFTSDAARHDFQLRPGEGLEIEPGQIHQAVNRSSAPVRFVVTSQPPSHNDRIDAV